MDRMIVVRAKNIFFISLLAISLLAIVSSCSTTQNTDTSCAWCKNDANNYVSGKRFDIAKITDIKHGMSMQEVVGIMGKPYTIATSSKYTQWIWSYADKDHFTSFTVQFQQGKLVHFSKFSDQDTR